MGKIKLLKGNNSISIDRITINENFEHLHTEVDTVKSTITNKNVETVSGKVDNQSTVPGVTLTQALESLKNTFGATGATGVTTNSLYSNSGATPNSAIAVTITDTLTFTGGSLVLASTNINIPNLPTTSTGLSSGDIYNDGGTLKIV